MDTTLPFTQRQIDAIAQKYPTPFHIYEEEKILDNSRNLSQTMERAGFTDFRNFFAVKVLPNPHIMKLLVNDGQGLDCSSIAELELAARIGIKGRDIMFSSNNTSSHEFARATQAEAIINFDDITHIKPFLNEFGTPLMACCRYNAGDLDFADAEEFIIGKPSEAKFGMTKPQIIEAYRMLQKAGVKEFGLHTMMLSNDTSWRNHLLIAKELFDVARQVSNDLKIHFSFINLGGGIGVAYRPNDKTFDLDKYAKGLRKLYDGAELAALGSPRIVMENGRYITANGGYLVTKVQNVKRTYKTYIGLDASMANLMRPAIYGAYHHITVLSKDSNGAREMMDVTGSLCENNDKFAINRELPTVHKGDYIIIHTTGAHGHAMGFQYNGKLRSAELLLKKDGTVQCIRRAETLDDYFATLTGQNVATIRKGV